MLCVKDRGLWQCIFPRANGRPLYGSLVIVVSVVPKTHCHNAQGKDGLSVGRSSVILS